MSVILGGLTTLTEYGRGSSIPFANGIRLLSSEDLASQDVPVYTGDNLGFSFWDSLRLTLGELLKTESDIPGNDLYLDRILARELTKGVMAANIDSYYNLPNWVKDGVPALVHGIDDIMTIARRYLLSNPMHLWLTLMGLENTIDTRSIKYPIYDYPTFAGYLALRYMSYQTVTGQTVIVPDQVKEFIVKGLNSDWIRESLKLIKDSFGIGFDESNASVTRITVNFKNSNDGTLTYVTPFMNSSTGKTVGLSLTINMYYYNDILLTDENGNPNNGQIYLDRSLAHELAIAVMAANIDYFNNFPAYIKRGLAELVRGIDDLRGSSILALASDSVKMQTALSPNSDESTVIVSGVSTPSYSAGYILLRYMANNVDGKTPLKVIKDFISYLSSTSITSSSNVLTVLDDAVSYASDDKWSDMNALHSDILNDIFLINYSDTPTVFLSQKCNIDLTNLDTGAITGFDADFSNPIKTAEDVVPENNFGSWVLPSDTSTTISGLTVKWPAGYTTNSLTPVVLTYTTQIDIIKAFMEELDKNGSGNLDSAISIATTGVFSGTNDLVNKLTNSVISAGILYGNEDAMKTFLHDMCGIYLDNLDTGSITGFDVSGVNFKTAEGVVPELIDMADWNLPVGSSSLINDLNVVWDTADIVDIGQYIDSSSRAFILRGLETVWIKSCLDLIYDSIGMKFGVVSSGGRGTTSVNTVTVKFVNDVTSPDRNKPAVMTFGYSGVYANELTLKINMRYYNHIESLNPNGSIKNTSEYSINTSLACIGDGFVSGYPFVSSKPSNSLDFYSWTSRLRQNFSDIAVYNLGVAREDSSDTLARFTPDVTDISPEYCLIMTGIEESFKSYTIGLDPLINPLPYITLAQSIFDNIKLTVDLARSYNMTPLVSYGVLPETMIKQAISALKSGTATTNEILGCKFVMLSVLGSLYEMVGTYTYHKLELIDFSDIFEDSYTSVVHTELFSSGYPNKLGYERLGDYFVSKLVVIYYDYYTKKEGWRYVFDLNSHTFKVYDSNNSVVKNIEGVQSLRDLQIDFTIFNSSSFEVLYSALSDMFYIPAKKVFDPFDGLSHEFRGVQNVNLPDSETEDYKFNYYNMAGNIYVGYYDAEVLDEGGNFVRFRQGITPFRTEFGKEVSYSSLPLLKYGPSIVPEILGWYARFLKLAHSNYFYIFEGEVLTGEKLYMEFESTMYIGWHLLLAEISKTMYPAINPTLRMGETINNRPIYEPWLLWNILNQLFNKYNRVLPPPWDYYPKPDDPYSEDKEGYIIPTLDLSPNMSY